MRPFGVGNQQGGRNLPLPPVPPCPYVIFPVRQRKQNRMDRTAVYSKGTKTPVITKPGNQQVRKEMAAAIRIMGQRERKFLLEKKIEIAIPAQI